MLRKPSCHFNMHHLKRTIRDIALRRRRAYLIIASPRSASNTLKESAQKSSKGLRVVSPKTEAGFGHFSVDVSKFPMFGKFIWYQHLFPTDRNTQLVLSLACGPPIVTWRNVFDWVVSMSEWIPRHGRSPWGIDADRLVLKTGNHTAVLEKEEACNYIIGYELPMYIRFLNGWQNFSNQCMRVNFLSYSEIVAEDCVSMERKLEESGFDDVNLANTEKITANVNIGRAGRGRKELSGSQIEECIKICESSSVPWILES